VIGLFGIGELLLTMEEGLLFDGVQAWVTQRGVWLVAKSMPRVPAIVDHVARVSIDLLVKWPGLDTDGARDRDGALARAYYASQAQAARPDGILMS
jgi:hypothetical protein